MSPADSPTELEKWLSYVLSLGIPIGFILGAYYLTYPMRGFKILGRNCILIATFVLVIYLVFNVVFR